MPGLSGEWGQGAPSPQALPSYPAGTGPGPGAGGYGGYPGYGTHPGYGPQWAPAPASYPAQSRRGNGHAVAALVLGITSIVFCWLGLLALAQWILALVLGGIGISNANRGASGKGLAVAGVVLGAVGMALYIVLGAVTGGALFIV